MKYTPEVHAYEVYTPETNAYKTHASDACP
jgi:hypothetical protein